MENYLGYRIGEALNIPTAVDIGYDKINKTREVVGAMSVEYQGMAERIGRRIDTLKKWWYRR